VCDRWHQSFESFLADMGTCPPGMTLGRKDNDKGYEPDNCEWQTQKSQANNRRNNHLITFNGKTQTLQQWSDETGMHFQTLRRRIVSGWPVDQVLTRPKMSRSEAAKFKYK
jgi:hypothetical protein